MSFIKNSVLLISTCLLIISGSFLTSNSVTAQNTGHVSGSLMLNQNFYKRDTTIGASGNALYNNFLSGGEGWLNLQYSNNGFTGIARFDLFNNSNIHNPTQAYSAQGIGFWSLSKELKSGLTVTGGNFYDQFGSGIVFRSYEDRGLGIDNAVYGLQLKYKLMDDKLLIKGFTGRQKNLFSTFEPIIKGLNAEYFIDVKGKLQLSPGASIVNRTLDQNSIAVIVNTINGYTAIDSSSGVPIYKDRFVPKYNSYAYSFYNTANFGNFSWYFEYAGKTAEAIKSSSDTLINKPGSVIFTSLNYSVRGFGITAQFKKTDHFVFRTSPNESLLKGMISFQPPLAKQNSLRLPARYNAATQELGELAFETDIFYAPAKGIKTSLNYCHIDNGKGKLLYQEVFGDVEIKKFKKTVLDLGVQYLNYNQAVYQGHPGYPLVVAVTPFMEVIYKFSDRRSIRTELQYQATKQDFGSWAFALIEYNVAPHWSFAVSDMYLAKVNPDDPKPQAHYYNFFSSYTAHSTRFTMAFVKQVSGIVCTGGVCRYEPAFSGLRMTINTSF
jgi:Family of unknown function (DUF6029)